jgi:ribosome-associated protein
VILRWNVWETESFDIEQKLRLIDKLGPRLTSAGEIIIRSDVKKSQLDNRNACIEKLEAIIESALHVPKKRKKTRPTKGSKERRKKSKQVRSKIKKLRRREEW